MLDRLNLFDFVPRKKVARRMVMEPTSIKWVTGCKMGEDESVL